MSYTLIKELIREMLLTLKILELLASSSVHNKASELINDIFEKSVKLGVISPKDIRAIELRAYQNAKNLLRRASLRS